MKRWFLIGVLIVLPALVFAAGMMGVGILMQPMSDGGVVPPPASFAITTEVGDPLTTESGDVIRTEIP